MALAIARTRTRPKPTLVDRALGTSRRRRRAAYVAFAAGFALLRPTLRRLGAAALAVATVLAVGLLLLLMRPG
ncbi:MAG: hypothetical protein H0W25_18630 [Acidimicrobiia bacterium]|nr:hypothetical protein [Acidimicrobiia bacterium]